MKQEKTMKQQDIDRIYILKRIVSILAPMINFVCICINWSMNDYFSRLEACINWLLDVIKSFKTKPR